MSERLFKERREGDRDREMFEKFLSFNFFSLGVIRVIREVFKIILV